MLDLQSATPVVAMSLPFEMNLEAMRRKKSKGANKPPYFFCTFRR